ncbi:MAG: hypothetical protein WAV47_06045 [Blastocatellia bacterium]
MFRLLIAILIAFSFVVSNFDPANATGSAFQGKRSMHITVSLDGLMVIDPNGSVYDVGVLIPSIADGHSLKVLVDGVRKSYTRLMPGDTWTLGVEGSSRPGVVPANLGHDKRRMDDNSNAQGQNTSKGQYDFDWIIDFDDLHRGLTIRPDLLTPIIHVTEGIIYSRYKTDFMKTKRGAGFGFFTETVALDLQIDPGQVLVLTSDRTHEVIFRVPYSATEPSHEVGIENTRDHPHEESDFPIYYLLFKVSQTKFDFEPDGSGRRPNNAVPRPQTERTTVNTKQKQAPSQVRKSTCCGLKCNPVQVSITPLKK